MKNNRGISLVSLIIMIIVMVILATIAIRIGTSGIDTAVESKYVNEKRELETAIVRRFADYSVSESAYPLIGYEVTVGDISDIEGIKSDDAEYIKEYIRKLDKGNLQSLGIQNTTGKEYIVDYLLGKVYGPIN